MPPLLVDDIRGGGWRPWAELTAGAALLAAMTEAGFSGQAFAYPFVPLAVLFFLVLRLGRRGAAVLPLIVVVLSFWHTTAGVGPFATGHFDTPLGPVVLVQIYSLVALAGSWLIAAVLDERQAAISALEDANINLEERVRERTAALDSQRRQAQTILGALQDGLVLLDTNQTVVEVNEAFSRLTGFARDDLIGATPPLPWWRPEDSTRISADAAAHVRVATPQYERMLRAADGSLIDAIVQGAPVLDAGGAAGGDGRHVQGHPGPGAPGARGAARAAAGRGTGPGQRGARRGRLHRGRGAGGGDRRPRGHRRRLLRDTPHRRATDCSPR